MDVPNNKPLYANLSAILIAFRVYLVSVSFAMNDIRYKLIHSAGEDVQQGNSNNAQRLPLSHRVVIVRQMKDRGRRYDFSQLDRDSDERIA